MKVSAGCSAVSAISQRLVMGRQLLRFVAVISIVSCATAKTITDQELHSDLLAALSLVSETELFKKLKDPEGPVQNLVSRVVHLSPKLGPILFQLPPRWAVNYERLESFLAVWPPTLRCVFELRDSTWMRPDVIDRLARFRAAFCIYEIAGYQSPLTVTTDFAYVRLHGPGSAKYQESYDEQRLWKWSRQIRDWARQLKSVYIYFDNDQAGFAARNALTLRRMVLDN
jgi:uncharacterized protein YecE (DUF72 family)